MSNDDLIRRGDVKTRICKEENADTWCGDGCDGNCYYMAVINRLPAVDAVEVVRCKDCMMLQFCRLAQDLGLDGFCSKGKRRREKDNADAI